MGKREIIRLDVTDSTNSVALALGKEGAATGTVVVAGMQTGGRGRLNRTWLSLPGMGLYFSIIMRPGLAPENLPQITLAVGLAVCKVLEAEFTISPSIKWPNDLLLDGRKFGGILTETESLHNISQEQHALVVVGVGLNLFPPEAGFPPELNDRATSLALHAERKISAAALLDACVDGIEEVLRRLEKGDFPVILQEWMQRDASRDKVLSWVTPQGQEVTGVSLGPDADGALRIRDEAGAIHTVLSGDITLAKKIRHKP